ncbi:hypothetical protein KR222_001249, partial [Zaprionus bogoriensis]
MLPLSLLLLLLAQSAVAQFQPAHTSPDEQFHEELVVRPLAGDHVNTYFQFTTRWHYGDHKSLYHTQLTPRVIAEILQTYDVKELHIGLTQGLWRYETWGYPIVEATGGAELWAWFSAPGLTDAAVSKQWMQLANVFSGVLCASLNFVDNTNSIAPKHIFRPQFMQSSNQSQHNHKFVRYATLPREIVCTENLTPWKKLLPCGSASGLATLLNSGFVHNTKYHSLGLKVRTLCDADDADNCIVELTQTANLVYDLRLLEQSNADFSLRRLFGMGLNGVCELASSSKIYAQRSEQGERFQLVPAPQQELISTRGGYTVRYDVYDLQQQFDGDSPRLFNIAWVAAKPSANGQARQRAGPPGLPPLYAHRFLLGNGQKSGRIATEITNTHYEPLPVLLLELVPWYVHAYLHTLRIRGRPRHRHDYGAQQELPFKLLAYAPGKQRERATHLEIGFLLPAHSSALITIEVDYLLLKWLEYPPDANHGHYIGAAVISSQLPLGRNYTALPLEGHLFVDSVNASRASYTLTLRTEALIVSLPTPDFSMPYNVICLACTVVALAFGPIHSVATKLIVVERQTSVPRNMLQRILYKLKSRLGKGNGKGKAKGKSTATA